MAEFIPGYETSSVFGIAAPGNTSGRLVDKLNRAVNAALADPRIRKRLADLGGTVLPGSPSDFEKTIQDEIEGWAKVVKFSGLKSG
jgi:tripartite-type tricarboxylate transporter receptor subunit TctC